MCDCFTNTLVFKSKRRCCLVTLEQESNCIISFHAFNDIPACFSLELIKVLQSNTCLTTLVITVSSHNYCTDIYFCFLIVQFSCSIIDGYWSWNIHIKVIAISQFTIILFQVKLNEELIWTICNNLISTITIRFQFGIRHIEDTDVSYYTCQFFPICKSNIIWCK